MNYNKKSSLKTDLFILALLIFIPRLIQLNSFLTADEPVSLKYSREFANGLANGDLSQTLGIGHPGVTVAWLTVPIINLASTDLGAYTAGRVAVALVTGVLLLVMYVLSRLLFGRGAALLAVGLLALDPYTLSYSRILHIAAPLSLFMTLSGLSYILWLRDSRRRWLIMAGIFGGLSLLTKSTALLLAPMLGVMLLGHGLYSDYEAKILFLRPRRFFKPARSKSKQSHNWIWWRQKLTCSMAAACIALLLFFLLWPAMWSNPAKALDITIGRLFTDQAAGTGNLGMFWFGRFVEDPGVAFYPVAFLLKATPWLLAGLLLSLWTIRRTPHTHLSLWLFALTYLVIMTIASKKSVRYMLPAFPTLYLLAGSALYQAVSKLKIKIPSHPAIQATVFLPFMLFTFFYHPYYFTYYNPLILGWRVAPQIMLVGWGEGLDEAARYLNHKPPQTVSVWYKQLFSVFYEGQVQDVVPRENLLTSDSTVLYINQVQRDIPDPNIIHYFRTRRQPEHTVRLNGIDYAWVYPGSVAGFPQTPPTPQYPLTGNFGNEAQLLGYNLHPQPRSGQPLIVTLYWQVLTTPIANRFVYLRLVDDKGHIWAKADSPPVMGLWPVDRWQPGMIIEDAQELPIPAGTPPGIYRLELGLYEPDSGQVLPASGQPAGVGGGLLLGEIKVEWQSVQAEPVLHNKADLCMSSNICFTGYNSLPSAATTGDILPVRLSWREVSSIFDLFPSDVTMITFEWREQAAVGADRGLIQQMDNFPLSIEQWGQAAILNTQHDIIVPPSLNDGRYELLLMLHNGSDPLGDSFTLGQIEIANPPHNFKLPTSAHIPDGSNQLKGGISLTGYNFTILGQTLNLHLYWQTDTTLTTSYKTFAQLLTFDNILVSQSDSFPRPTTGWLKGEIITNSHTLNLPPGNYKLITGLYNSLTGERLPLANGNGNAIVVSERIGE